jgi:predicted metal-dependent hydrolase
MIALVLEREARSRRGDDHLATMATLLLAQYLPEFHERPSSIRWRNMQGRWGSCTTVDGTIRIAGRLASAPEYVLRCVLFHELIHLRLPDHGPEFKAFLARYPDLARAEAFLEGFEAGLAGIPEPITPQELEEEILGS